MAETSLEIRLGAPKSRSRVFFSSSEAYKNDPRGKKERTKNRAPKWTPKQDAGDPEMAECAGPRGELWEGSEKAKFVIASLTVQHTV